MSDVIRVEGRKGYTILQNEMVLDKRLSLKTKGLMAVLLSRPEGWEFSVSGLAAFCGCGKDAIRSSLGELERAGYLSRRQRHGERGKFEGNEYIIREALSSEPPEPSQEAPLSENPTTEGAPLSENPTTEGAPLSGFPSSGKPSSGKPSSGNPTQRKKDLKKYGLKEIPPKAPQGGQDKRKITSKWKPERFDAFWEYYKANFGRTQDHEPAAREWDKLKPDEDTIRAIGRDLEWRLKYDDEWRRGIGIPYACRYLKKRKWEEEHMVKLPAAAEETEAEYGDRTLI